MELKKHYKNFKGNWCYKCRKIMDPRRKLKFCKECIEAKKGGINSGITNERIKLLDSIYKKVKNIKNQ